MDKEQNVKTSPKKEIISAAMISSKSSNPNSPVRPSPQKGKEQNIKTPTKNLIKSAAKTSSKSPNPKSPMKLSSPRPSPQKDNKRKENIDPNVPVPVIDKSITAENQTITAEITADSKTHEIKKRNDLPKNKPVREKVTEPEQPKLVGEQLSWGVWTNPREGFIKFEGFANSHANLLTENEIKLLYKTDKSIEEILDPRDDTPDEIAEENEDKDEKTKETEETIEKQEKEEAIGKEENSEKEKIDEEEQEKIRIEKIEKFMEDMKAKWKHNVEKSQPMFVNAPDILKLKPKAKESFLTNNDRSVPPVMIFTKENMKWLKHYTLKEPAAPAREPAAPAREPAAPAREPAAPARKPAALAKKGKKK